MAYSCAFVVMKKDSSASVFMGFGRVALGGGGGWLMAGGGVFLVCFFNLAYSCWFLKNDPV